MTLFTVLAAAVIALSPTAAAQPAAALPIAPTDTCVAGQILGGDGICVPIGTSTTTTVTPCPAGQHHENGVCVDNRNRDRYGHYPRGPIYGGPVYNDCATNWAHGIRDIRREDPRYRDAWDLDRDGVACDNGDQHTTIINNNNGCTTVVQSYNNYNRSVDAWNRGVRLYGGRLDDSNRRILARYYDDRIRALNDYNNRRSTVNTTCSDAPTPATVQVVQAPSDCGCTNSAPPVVTSPAPEPTYSAPRRSQVYDTPSGASEAGDGSTFGV